MGSYEYRQMVWNYYYAARDFKAMEWIPSSAISKAIERINNDIR